MSQAPEYKVLHSNRPKLEGHVEDHMTRIARQLESSNILTRHQYEEVTSDPKKGARNMVGIILRSVEEDSHTFAYFLDVLKKVGNTGLRSCARNIEDERKKLYRDLFPEVSDLDNEPFDVFISYGREQETNAFVDKLVARLTRSRLKVFVDRSDIATGDVWPTKIASALYSCKAFVAVLTKKYVKSHYCNGELYQAEARKKQLFPVVFEDDWHSESSGASVKAFANWQRYTYFREGKDDVEKQFGVLRDIIDKCIHPETGSLSEAVVVTRQSLPRERPLDEQLDDLKTEIGRIEPMITENIKVEVQSIKDAVLLRYNQLHDMAKIRDNIRQIFRGIPFLEMLADALSNHIETVKSTEELTDILHWQHRKRIKRVDRNVYGIELHYTTKILENCGKRSPFQIAVGGFKKETVILMAYMARAVVMDLNPEDYPDNTADSLFS